MDLKNYFSKDGTTIRFSRQQASQFAKEVAGDFNPIHNQDAKRFCVPGDLLFALVLNRYGLSQHMHCTFSGMVGEGIGLNFPPSDSTTLSIADEKDKEYLTIKRRGERSTDQVLLHDLTRSYVEFSGQTFPHILVPLMSKHGVMINPDRPLVIYESMEIDIDRLEIQNPQLTLTDSSLEITGKRGTVSLEFTLSVEGEVVGRGKKSMLLSGLRPFNAERITQLADDYAARKAAYCLG